MKSRAALKSSSRGKRNRRNSSFGHSLDQLETRSLLSAAAPVDFSAPGGDLGVHHSEDVGEPVARYPSSGLIPTPTVTVNDSFGVTQSIRDGANYDAVVRVSGGTGTLIAPDLVITAWHIRPTESTTVYFGDTARDYAVGIAGIIDVTSEQRTTHYDGRDILLLRLDAPVPAHIATPVKLTDATVELLGQEAVVTGFGNNGLASVGNGLNQSGDRWAGKNVIDTYMHPNMFGTDLDNGTNEANVLRDFGSSPIPLSEEAATSQGDSGGPLLVALDGEWVLAGITNSTSDSFGRYGAWSGYTSVSPFRKIIEDAGGVFKTGTFGITPGIQVSNGDFEIGAPAKGQNKNSIEGWSDGSLHPDGNFWTDTWHANNSLPPGSGAAAGLTGNKSNSLFQRIGYKLPSTRKLDFSVDLLSFTDVKAVRSGELQVEIYQGDSMRFIGESVLRATMSEGERRTLTGRIDVTSADSTEDLRVVLFWNGDWMALDNFSLTEVSSGIEITNGNFESGSPAYWGNNNSVEGWNDGDYHPNGAFYEDTWHTYMSLPEGTGAAVGLSGRRASGELSQEVGKKFVETQELEYHVDLLSFTNATKTVSGQLTVEILQGESRQLIGQSIETVTLGRGERQTLTGRIDVTTANSVDDLTVNLSWSGEWMSLDNFYLSEVGPQASPQFVQTTAQLSQEPVAGAPSNRFPSAQRRRESEISNSRFDFGVRRMESIPHATALEVHDSPDRESVIVRSSESASRRKSQMDGRQSLNSVENRLSVNELSIWDGTELDFLDRIGSALE